jgi:hypothetical protein
MREKVFDWSYSSDTKAYFGINEFLLTREMSLYCFWDFISLEKKKKKNGVMEEIYIWFNVLFLELI